MSRKRMSPREARTFKDVCRLNRDNFGTETGWIQIGENDVTVACQCDGEEATSMTTVSRADFNKFVDWYNRKQKCKEARP